MPDSVIGNTSDFESGTLSSNLSLATNVVSSLFGKVPHCDCGEQGSIPGDNQDWLIVQRKKNTALRMQR